MSCYLPVIEKLKAAVVLKGENGGPSAFKPPKKSNKELIEAAAEAELHREQLRQQQVHHQAQIEADAGFYENDQLKKRRPQREVNGLTITQEVGVFPNNVELNIRHAHPSLGLKEVAHVRQQGQQCYLQQQPKGVLSLGLPDNLRPKTLRSKTPTPTSKMAQPPASATSEAIHHYYETLSPKYMNINKHQDLNMTIKTDSGQASGGSTNSSLGSHSPPHGEEVNTPQPRPRTSRPPILSTANRGPPPRHLLPATLRPSPPVKMHPPGVVLNLKGKGRAYLEILFY